MAGQNLSLGVVRQRPTRRQYLSLTGGALLLGAASEPAAAAEPISGVNVPPNPGKYRFETMGADGDAPKAYLFGNFKCPYTREFVRGNLHDVIREFVNPGDLKLQFLNVAYEPDNNLGRSSPTHGDGSYFISSSDPRIARVSLGAWEVDPGSYWGFFQDMFADQPSGWVTYEDLRDRLYDSGVSNRDEIIARAKTDRYEDELRAAEDAAVDFGIPFTPRLALAGDMTAPHHGIQGLFNWIEARIPETSTSTASSGFESSGTDGSAQIGTVSRSQPDSTTWHDVSLGGHEASVVMMGPVSANGPHSVHPRLRDVDGDSFQFKLEEWDYLGDKHTEERLSYLALSEGTDAFASGTAVDVGRVQTDDDFEWISFDAGFDADPVLLTQTLTFAGPHPVVTRQASVTPNGASVRLQESESRGAHWNETLGYVAIEPGETTIGGVGAEAGHETGVTDEWQWIDFSRSYDSPAFVASIQTENGWNTVNLRYRNLIDSGVSVRLEEEQSGDRETTHVEETVSYFVAEQ
jgi:hypothetical protein